MTHDETSREVYIDIQEIKPESSNNHNTDTPDIYLHNPNQEAQRKCLTKYLLTKRRTRGKKDRNYVEIAENEEINLELVVDSSEERKTNSENQQDLEKEKVMKDNMMKKPQCKRSRIILVRS